MLQMIAVTIVGDVKVGKTTLMRSLLKYDDIDVKEINRKNSKRKIIYAFTDIVILVISDKPSSHKSIKFWLRDIRIIKDIPIIIVRNIINESSKTYTVNKIKHKISLIVDNIDELYNDIKKLK